MKTKRLLSIDFAHYAGDDSAFKNELIRLIIEYLGELEQAYYSAVDRNNPSVLLKAIHKMHTIMSMLDDKELIEIIEDLKNPTLGPSAIMHYKMIRAEITESLLAEKS